jgi:hypothetical protein
MLLRLSYKIETARVHKLLIATDAEPIVVLVSICPRIIAIQVAYGHGANFALLMIPAIYHDFTPATRISSDRFG